VVFRLITNSNLVDCSTGKSAEPELKLPSDAEVDKVISFLERVWRRLIEMGRSVQKDIERKN